MIFWCVSGFICNYFNENICIYDHEGNICEILLFYWFFMWFEQQGDYGLIKKNWEIFLLFLLCGIIVEILTSSLLWLVEFSAKSTCPCLFFQGWGNYRFLITVSVSLGAICLNCLSNHELTLLGSMFGEKIHFFLIFNLVEYRFLEYILMFLWISLVFSIQIWFF